MLFEIKHISTESLLFSLETESLKLCLETAVKSGANLDGANLRGANLRGAYLDGAYLGGEVLKFAPVSILNLRWDVLITGQYMRIGCQHYTHQKWKSFGNERISEMHAEAVDFWTAYGNLLLTLCDIEAKKAHGDA